MRWLLCRVKDRLCGIPLEHVVETMRMLPIERVASAPGFVRGLSVIRGEAIPVVDVAALLEEQAEPARLVTVRVEGRRVALAVGAVEGIGEFEGRQPLPPLLAQNEALGALAVLDRELLLVLENLALWKEGWTADV